MPLRNFARFVCHKCDRQFDVFNCIRKPVNHPLALQSCLQILFRVKVFNRDFLDQSVVTWIIKVQVTNGRVCTLCCCAQVVRIHVPGFKIVTRNKRQ